MADLGCESFIRTREPIIAILVVAKNNEAHRCVLYEAFNWRSEDEQKVQLIYECPLAFIVMTLEINGHPLQ